MEEATQDPAPEVGAESVEKEAGAFDFAALTDAGMVRPHNEDHAGAFLLEGAAGIDGPVLLCLVADGMGGHQAGEVASREAVQQVLDRVQEATGDDPGTCLAHAFHAANRAIHQQAQADPQQAGMGTTLVAALIVGRKVYLANVGDSRAYLIDAQGALQITDDHSWVEEQVRAGLLTPEQARSHPQRNLVTRALGSRPEVEVDLYEGSLEPGETLLLCSDGLSNELEDRELAEIVLAHLPQAAAERLLEAANERGGKDNLSVVIARSGAPPLPALAGESPTGRFAGSPALPFLLALALLLALVAIGLFLAPQFLGAGR